MKKCQADKETALHFDSFFDRIYIFVLFHSKIQQIIIIEHLNFYSCENVANGLMSELIAAIRIVSSVSMSN